MKIQPINTIAIKSFFPKSKVTKPINLNPVLPAALMTTATASAIAAAAMIKKEVSVNDIEKKLTENGFVKDEYGEFSKTFSPEEANELSNKIGPHINEYRKIFKTPLQKETLILFKDFLNIDKEKGAKLLEKNFNKTLTTFLILGYNGRLKSFIDKCKENKNYFGLIENIANCDIESHLKSIASYKTDTLCSINFVLRKQYADNTKIPSHMQTEINNISNCINTQPIKNPIKLYRGEGYEVLSKVKLENGKTLDLAKLMLKAKESNNPQKIKKVRELILNHEIKAFQPGFLSTSTNKRIGEKFACSNCILWEITTKPKTKGVFVEGLNITGYYSSEDEVLLQKGTTLKINDAKYDKETKNWIICAEASN